MAQRERLRRIHISADGVAPIDLSCPSAREAALGQCGQVYSYGGSVGHSRRGRRITQNRWEHLGLPSCRSTTVSRRTVWPVLRSKALVWEPKVPLCVRAYHSWSDLRSRHMCHRSGAVRHRRLYSGLANSRRQRHILRRAGPNAPGLLYLHAFVPRRCGPVHPSS